MIASASQEASIYDGERLATGGASTSSNASLDPAVGLDASAGTKKRRRDSLVKLLALDMDGTLLNGESQVLPSSVEALHAALSTGVKVCLATGKARPAALSAMEKVGLAGRTQLPNSILHKGTCLVAWTLFRATYDEDKSAQ